MPESQLLPTVLLPSWEKLFFGRALELDAIKQQVLGENPSERPPILAISGVSGVGKSALCGQALAQIPTALLRKAGVCRLDFDSPRYHAGYPHFELFGKVLYPALRSAGFKCPLFLVMYTAWAARIREQSAISQSTILQDLLDQGKESGEFLEEKDKIFEADWLEVFGEAAEGFGTAKLVLKAATYLKASRQRSRFSSRFADVDLKTVTLSELDKLATKALAADLICQLEHSPRRLTFLVDGFERLQSDDMAQGAEWAIQQLLGNLLLSPASEQVRCIFFSRISLTWTRFDRPGAAKRWDDLIEQRDLQGLIQADAERFLIAIEVWYERAEQDEGPAIAQCMRANRDHLLRACRDVADSTSFHALAMTVAVEQVARHHRSFSPQLLGQNASDMYNQFVRDLAEQERGLLEILSIFEDFSETEFVAALSAGLLPRFGTHHFSKIVGERQYCISAAKEHRYRIHAQLARAMHSWCTRDVSRRKSYFRACELLLKTLLKTAAEAATTSYVRAEQYLQSYLVVASNYELAREECNAAWFLALVELDMQLPPWVGLELRITAFLRHALANMDAAGGGDLQAVHHHLAALTRAAELMYAIGDYGSCLSTVERALDVMGNPDAKVGGVVWATLKLHQGVALIRTNRVPEGESILAHLVTTSSDWFELSIEGVRSAGKLAGSLGDFVPERGLNFIDWLVTNFSEGFKEKFGSELRQLLATVEANLALKVHDLSRAVIAMSMQMPGSDGKTEPIDPITDAMILILKAQVALEQADREGAIAFAMQAVRLVNCVEGAREQSRSQVLADAGVVLRDAGASEDWLAILRESLRLYESSDGPESHLSVPVRTALAHGLIARGGAVEAVRLLRKNLVIMEGDLGPDHRELIPAVINLANALMHEGQDHENAHALFTRALAIAASSPDTTKFDRGVVLANWGAHQLERFDFDDAKARLDEAVVLLRAMDGYAEGHLPKALYNLAGIVQMKGDTVRALQLLEEARTFVKRYRGDEADELSGINELTLAIIEGRMRTSRRPK